MQLRNCIIGAGQLMYSVFYLLLPCLAEDQKLAQGDIVFVPSPTPLFSVY
jgi:hypothetical protein